MGVDKGFQKFGDPGSCPMAWHGHVADPLETCLDTCVTMQISSF